MVAEVILKCLGIIGASMVAYAITTKYDESSGDTYFVLL